MNGESRNFEREQHAKVLLKQKAAQNFHASAEQAMHVDPKTACIQVSSFNDGPHSR